MPNKKPISFLNLDLKNNVLVNCTYLSICKMNNYYEVDFYSRNRRFI